MKQTVRATRIIRLCALEALEDSGIEPEVLRDSRTAVIIGTSGSSVRGPMDRERPGEERFRILREMTNAAPAWISIEKGLMGPSYTVSAACASGAYAIARAFDLIRTGAVDLAVAGGVDTLLTPNQIRRGTFLQVLSQRNDEPGKAVRPFDRSRDGWVLSDGGCAVILESFARATQRDAEVYAWIHGYGTLFRPLALTSPETYTQSLSQTIQRALIHGRFPKKRIHYVGANGNATFLGDRAETSAIKSVFRKRAHALWVPGHKSMLGHTGGASGAITFAISSMVLKSQRIPPTINLEDPDPFCDLNHVPLKAAEAPDLDAALSHCFGLEGHHCVIVLSRSP